MPNSESAKYQFDPMAYCNYHRYPMRGHSFENCHRRQRSMQWSQSNIGIINRHNSYQMWLENSFHSVPNKENNNIPPVPISKTVVDLPSLAQSQCCQKYECANSSKNIVPNIKSKEIYFNNTISLGMTKAEKSSLIQKQTSIPILNDSAPIKFKKFTKKSENTYSENSLHTKIEAEMAGAKMYPLCDTGSQLTLVSEKFVSKFVEKIVSYCENTSPNQVSKLEKSVLGTAKFYLNIGDEKFAICAQVVPNLEEDSSWCKFLRPSQKSWKNRYVTNLSNCVVKNSRSKWKNLVLTLHRAFKCKMLMKNL